MQRFFFFTIAILLAGSLSAMERFAFFSNVGMLLNKNSAVTIYVDGSTAKGVKAAAENLCSDITAVCGAKTSLTTKRSKATIVISTKPNGKWESYTVKADNKQLTITGSDARGTIYGIYELSSQIGMSPWYWWADVPAEKHPEIYIKAGEYTNGEPSVKYRGIFINDEDWGLKPWSSKNYEKELGDIGPKTYAKVCELILRLKGNMLAPAMHSCTGAFYSHPESKIVADSLGVIITTSHCEPLLLNNAAKSEWDKARDGEWNYATNKETIQRKWNDRLNEAAHLDNIYTMAMRGVHDEGLRGNLPMKERVSLLNQVIKDQREMLVRHTGKQITDIPQIFVPYKETMDVYEAGLEVPEDITIVWVDDNYGYMKRVSTPEEQKRSGGFGVYYHLSYLGTPHDYLWLNTTPPMLMYLELMKAYRAGADRYWLLNVGDIKPMELGISTFFDMAWDTNTCNTENILQKQPDFLADIFGAQYKADFQQLLNKYYDLAWTRKPEFMGGEWEWDDAAHTGLQSTQFVFADGSAQQRLHDYQQLSDLAERIMLSLDHTLQPAFFEMVAYPVEAAYQMNRKFLMAQLNKELAEQNREEEANWAAQQSKQAYDSIASLTNHYNKQLDGKWDGMMAIPPGFCALYDRMPKLQSFDGKGTKEPDTSLLAVKNPGLQTDLATPLSSSGDYNILYGVGKNHIAARFGDASADTANASATYQLPATQGDTVTISLSTLPFFPIYKGKDNRIGVSVDGGKMVILSNHVEEWSREWKDQVMINAKEYSLRFPLNTTKQCHTITITAIDPGQIVQEIKVIQQ